MLRSQLGEDRRSAEQGGTPTKTFENLDLLKLVLGDNRKEPVLRSPPCPSRAPPPVPLQPPPHRDLAGNHSKNEPHRQSSRDREEENRSCIAERVLLDECDGPALLSWTESLVRSTSTPICPTINTLDAAMERSAHPTRPSCSTTSDSVTQHQRARTDPTKPARTGLTALFQEPVRARLTAPTTITGEPDQPQTAPSPNHLSPGIVATRPRSSSSTIAVTSGNADPVLKVWHQRTRSYVDLPVSRPVIYELAGSEPEPDSTAIEIGAETNPRHEFKQSNHLTPTEHWLLKLADARKTSDYKPDQSLVHELEGSMPVDPERVELTSEAVASIAELEASPVEKRPPCHLPEFTFADLGSGLDLPLFSDHS